MRISRASFKKKKKRALILPIALASLMIATASPAGADEIEGSGAGAGWEYAGPGQTLPAPECEVGNPASATLRSKFEITHEGTYSGAATEPAVSPVAYVGPTEVTLQTDNYVASPLGTHDPEIDPTCTVPLPVPITGTVSTPPGETGNVTCSGGPVPGEHNGEFLRVQSAVTITFTSTCTVRDALGNQATAQVRHVLEGTMTPCTLAPTEEPNPECDAAQLLFPSDPDPSSFYEGTYQAESVSTA